VADHLGGAETVAGLIEPIQTSPSPRLVLTPPLRWADDAEVPLQMLVQYETFAVLRGCGPDAVACNLTRAVQVVPLDRLVAPSPEWSGTKMWIESSAARPPDDPYHLDPGPLEPRGGQTVLWTGGEMLVWGGATSDAPATRIDGAAFDPDTGVWRPIAEPPLEGLQPNAAVWTGDVMVVIARDATLTYDPDADSWETIGEGLLAGQAIWVDDRPFVWNATGVFGFDDGTWTPLPDPGFGSAETWQGTLLNLDGSLLASGLANGLRCQPRRMAVWDGSSWRDLPSFSLATPALADCSLANQSAVVGDDVLVWESNDHPTLRYDPADGAWNEVARIPNPSTEGPAGPVALDGRVLVPFNGSGAIFDARDDTWTPVALPGGGDATDMVWTGDELLMWGATCCYGAGDAPFSIDAWRWEPPG
jgi:hypothetical protein